MPPDRGLSDKKHSGVKGNKVRLTFALTSNADGSIKKEAFIIGKAKKPHAFGGKSGGQLGFYYRNNAKAWMTGALYGEWIKNWDDELRREDRKILLLQDNCTGHIVPEGLTNIHVESFSANLTPHVQPMDAGIIRCFKAHYRAWYVQRAIDRYDSGITPSEIYDINQLEGMCLAQTAWHEVDASTICHCWLKAGILPDSAFSTNTVPPRIMVSSLLCANDPIQSAERNVESSLDELEQTGVLQHANRLMLNDLLNPEPERQVIEHTTDEEIFHAVMASRAAEEDMELVGGADDDDDDAVIPPWPSRKAALEEGLPNEQPHETIIKIDLPQPRGTVSTRIRPYELILTAGTLELSVKIHPTREYTYIMLTNEEYAHTATIYHNRPLIQAHTELRPETPSTTPSPHIAPEPPSDSTLGRTSS
jgi:hypothetical protein